VRTLHQKPGKSAQGSQQRVGTESREVAEAMKSDRNEGKPSANLTAQLMESCVSRDNVLKAWKRVKQNGGSAGVDGMTVEEAGPWLRTHWPRVRMELLEGSHQPAPVRGVEIPKAAGGMRQLGIPTVLDRLIQQCILQVLQPSWDPTFHPDSYGFRPGKSAHQAVCRAQSLIQEGRRYCVDVDLEKFFDRVNHDVLMDRVMKRIGDRRVTELIRRYLKAGILKHGIMGDRSEGTPQGGPLSPFLSNLLLNEIDWELEKRNLKFVRYADDCNVYVRSRRAAEDAMATLQKLYGNLRLRINEKKSAVALAWERKFLGYSFWIGAKRRISPRIAPESVKRMKERVRWLTRRSCGRSLEQVVKELSGYLRGWKEYFRLAENRKLREELDGWIRRRLRMLCLKQWKRGRTWYRELVARGLSPKAAASISGSPRSYWFMAGTSGVSVALPNSTFTSLGLLWLKV
jgi:RNA-directed DNA polymerase